MQVKLLGVADGKYTVKAMDYEIEHTVTLAELRPGPEWVWNKTSKSWKQTGAGGATSAPAPAPAADGAAGGGAAAAEEAEVEAEVEVEPEEEEELEVEVEPMAEDEMGE